MASIYRTWLARLADYRTEIQRIHGNSPSLEDLTRAANAEREDWYRLSATGLERAYGEDEPEYTEDMFKEPNPNYERG